MKRKETHARRIERDRETQSETESRNQQECCEALRREEPVILSLTEPEAGGECVPEAVCVCDGWRCRRVCVCMGWMDVWKGPWTGTGLESFL